MKKHTSEILNRISNKQTEENITKLLWHRMQILFNYQHEKIKNSISLIKAGIVLHEYKAVDHPYNHWDIYTEKNVDVYTLPYDHESIMHSEASFDISCLINNTLKTL